jgi:hypothetical protein
MFSTLDSTIIYEFHAVSTSSSGVWAAFYPGKLAGILHSVVFDDFSLLIHAVIGEATIKAEILVSLAHS